MGETTISLIVGPMLVFLVFPCQPNKGDDEKKLNPSLSNPNKQEKGHEGENAFPA